MSQENPEKALTLRQRIDAPEIRARFQEVLGKKAAAFVSSVISATKTNPALGKCQADSVISAAMVAATLDLPINPSLGFAHIVPYANVAQFQMGWKGFNQLGLRSGQFARMNASPVFEGQLKKWDNITGDFEYDLTAKTGPKIVGYVSYFRLTNGYEHYFYMTTEEIRAHAARYSQAYKKGYGPWIDNFDSMALKTVHKLNLSKWAPMTSDMELALRIDQAVVKGIDKPIEDADFEYPDGDGITPIHEEAETATGKLNMNAMKKGDPATHQDHPKTTPKTAPEPSVDATKDTTAEQAPSPETTDTDGPRHPGWAADEETSAPPPALTDEVSEDEKDALDKALADRYGNGLIQGGFNAYKRLRVLPEQIRTRADYDKVRKMIDDATIKPKKKGAK